MIPEPIPCVVCWVMLFGSTPSSKIRTTDGPALEATSMMADDSSTLTGWRTDAALGLLPFAPVDGPVRSNAPLAFRAITVPPDARTAAASAAARTVPAPPPRCCVTATG